MFINDPVHGFLKLNQMQVELIELPELQRLQWIKQLGLSFLSYPGGTHTRFSHAIGVSYIAGEMASVLGISDKEKEIVKAAGLLHDVGHTPFSHTLESLLPVDHMVWTKSLITGEKRMNIPNSGRIPEVLRKHGLDPEEVGALVNSKHTSPVLQNIIHGNVDADQLDYLPRDAYFCGISHGHIDLYRLLHTLEKDDLSQKILLLEKGIDALEEMLIARDHMYSAVYAHKTGRIAEMMLLRAAEAGLDVIGDFRAMTDAQLISVLIKADGVPGNLVSRILYRKLYKTAFVITSTDSSFHDKLEQILRNMTAEQIETEISRIAGIERHEVIVDTPVEVLKLSEPRLKQLEMDVLTKNGTVKALRDISPLAKALEGKESTHVLFAVFTPVEYRTTVGKAAEQLLT